MVAITEYARFFQNNTRFLLFGCLMAFTSSAGQTYFVGIFGPEIRETFSLNHTQWGSIYLVGTLCSALVLPWSGQLIDRYDLRTYATVVIIGLALACLTTSLAPTIVLLTFSVFLLRHFGQGLTSHISVTSMARYLNENRGKGIAIASVGYSIGEASLPFLTVIAIAAWGWRSTYLLTALCVLAILPVMLWLLQSHKNRHESHVNAINNIDQSGAVQTRSVSRRQMLRESRFYLLLPAVFAPSYIGTALFFHHLTLAETKNWSGLWVTGNYWVYAVVTVLTSLISGPLIDRYTAARVLPYYLVPLIAGLLILVPAQNPLWVIPYMTMLGINTGVMFTAVNALWAELYGAKYLGGIKSTVGALSVFASSLGPVTIGVLLDLGYSFETVCVVFAVFCGAATILLILGLKRFAGQ